MGVVKFAKMTCCVALLCLWSTLAMAHSKEWQQGWCPGYKEAIKSSERNVSNFRALNADSVAGKTVVAETVRIMLDGVDSYVALPPLRGKVVVVFPNGEKFDCGN